jgi:ABC-2 type transport system permease protein
MPIFDQGYQHWNGQPSGHAWRWLAITRQGVLSVMKLKGVRWVIIIAWAPALLLAVFLSIWGLLEQQSELLTPFLNIINALPEEIRQGPKSFRKTIWTLGFYNFFAFEINFSLVIVAIVGPSLISQDLRFNAMPLYFSKPLRRIDYFIGKLGVIATFVLAVAAAPAALAYLLGVAFSMDSSVLADTWRLLAASLLFGLIVSVSAGVLMLAISSLSKNARYVAVLWVGFWLVSSSASAILTESVRKPWCALVGYQQNLSMIRNSLLDVSDARDQIVALIESSERKMREAMQSAGPLGRFAPMGRRGRPMPPPRPPRPELGEDEPSLPENRKIPFVPDRDSTPWTWPAGALFGLFVLSTWTLTNQVKSLDRLR